MRSIPMKYDFIDRQKLRHVRDAGKWSLQEVAEAVGSYKELIYRMEKGTSTNMNLLCAMAVFYDADVRDFIFSRPTRLKGRRVKAGARREKDAVAVDFPVDGPR